MNRRVLLRQAACGFGSVALEGLLAAENLHVRTPHHAARAKRIIFLFMQGGPSQIDLFEYKPELEKRNGQPLTFKLPKNYEAPGIRDSRIFGPMGKFVRQGQRGMLLSEMLPHIGGVVDDLCFLHGMHADSEAHAPAIRQLHTGQSIQVRPSMGAWTLYGLGTENQNLPGFVTICPVLSGDGGTPQLFGSAFLPAIYQGTRIGSGNRFGQQALVKNLQPPGTPQAQRLELDLIQSLNREAQQRDPQNAALEGVIESYELAFKMQSQMPAVLDIAKESDATKKLYGVGDRDTDDFGRKCLMARRFIEAGVRFVEVGSGNWDHHFNLSSALARNCSSVDKPIAGLLTDLKQRGLLKDTLVIWGGEFGRTPYAQGGDGRDHNNKGFTLWMAGGGTKGGTSYGATDDHGAEAVQDKVSIHDLHATILHQLGLDHEKLTFRYAGRDFRLTDVKGEVVKGVLA